MTSADTSQARTPETTDRMMVGVCGAIWLVLLVISVIATVALVGLARGHRPGGEETSPWLLYTIIGVSALTIIGAIPLLLKARRAALESRAATDVDTSPPAKPRPAAPAREAATEKMRVFGTTVDPYATRRTEPGHALPAVAAAAERVWLRGTTSLLGAMGLALIGVSTATYLLAVGSDTAAWVALGFGGILTAAMPAVLVFFNRQLSAIAQAG